MSALALGGRTKKHESSYPGAKCQKEIPGNEQKNMLGNVEKKTWTGQAPSYFFLPGTYIKDNTHMHLVIYLATSSRGLSVPKSR